MFLIVSQYSQENNCVCKYREMFVNIFFEEHLRKAASGDPLNLIEKPDLLSEMDHSNIF